MILCDVRNLVGEHAGELALCRGSHNQPGVDTDEAAGKRESIYPGIPDDKKVELVATLMCVSGQTMTEPREPQVGAA